MGLSLCNVWVAELRLRLFVEAKMETQFEIANSGLSQAATIQQVRRVMANFMSWFYRDYDGDFLDNSDLEIIQLAEECIGVGYSDVAQVYLNFLLARKRVPPFGAVVKSEVSHGK